VRIAVFGAVTVSGNGRSVTGHALGGRRARVALVALALAGRPVSADSLAAVIWAQQPPPTWPAALRGIIRGLRECLAAIGADGRQLVVTVPSGYALAPGVEVDLRQAEDILREVAALAGWGRHDAAVEAAEPVTRFSGEQLLPGEDADWLAPYRAEADAAALRALELLAASASALGDHHRAVAAGRQAVAVSPLDERSHRILLRALHLGGDRAAVVRAYESCRRVLADQLGVDPAAETVEVYLTALADAGGVDPMAAGRLPQVASAFFGRDAETALLAAAIARPGLVTVTGKGGVGKTRLALQVVNPAAFPGAKLWVSLASVAHDALVAGAVAMSAGLPVGTDDPAELLAARLAPVGRAVLILDGCEAVIDGTASLVVGLLAACPMLSVLATSRLPLAIDAEQVITVEPLPRRVQVRLLADRVAGGGGRLAVHDATAPLIAELCRRCGGLPLALELAAAQLAVTSVPDLLDHLPEVLAGGGDWLRAVAMSSYALLDDDEATVFRRFGVLDGPVPLPLIREVVSGGAITPVRVVRILRELTERGLLIVDRSDPRWRYRQDDDLHRLACELLADTGEAGLVTHRLADTISAIVPSDPRAAPEPYLAAIGEVLPSIRSLLAAALDGRLAGDLGLDLAFRLHRYWAATNLAEGRFWLSRLLADVPRTARTAHCAYALGYLSYWSGDTAAAVTELKAAVRLMRGEPDAYAARALIYLGGLADDLDHGEEALGFVRQAIAAAAPFGADLQVGAAIGMGCVLAERADEGASRYAVEAIELCRRAGSAEQLAATLPTAAMVCWQVGDLDAARRYVAEAMPLLGESRRIARVVLLSAAAGIALADGDRDAAIELASVADTEATDLGVERELPLIRTFAARALLGRGDIAAAACAALRAIDAARALAYSFPLATCLETAALVCLHGASGADAGRLLGVAAAIRQRGDRPGPPALRAAATVVRAASGIAADPAGAAPADLPAAVTAAVATAVTALRAVAESSPPIGQRSGWSGLK